jgi:hypothetical protein
LFLASHHRSFDVFRGACTEPGNLMIVRRETRVVERNAY